MFHFLAIMIFASVANWFIIFPMIALIIVFLAMRFYYLKSSQEIKRLEAVGRFTQSDGILWTHICLLALAIRCSGSSALCGVRSLYDCAF